MKSNEFDTNHQQACIRFKELLFENISLAKISYNVNACTYEHLRVGIVLCKRICVLLRVSNENREKRERYT